MSFKSLFAVRDVTNGEPWKRIAGLAIPLLIGNIAQTLYNTVDTVVVGRYVGDNALSAVGVSNPITNLLFILFTGVATGAGILVSQRFGAKDREGLSKVIGNVLFLAVLASLITTALGLIITRVPIFGGKTLLTLLNTPEGEIYDWSQIYLTVIFAGVIGTVFYNLTAGILRGLGDSVTALIFLLLTCVLNIVLDLWFVAGFGWGVFGVAIATIISQMISAVLCLIKLFHMKDVFTLDRSTMKPDKTISKRILALGMPSGISQGLFAMSSIFVQSLTNSMGAAAMASSVICARIDGFAMMPCFSIGNAMTTYAGQNYGAKNLGRLEKGTRQCMIMMFGISFVLTSTMLIFGRALAGLFTETAEITDLSIRMIRILGIGYLVFGVSQVMQSYLRGIGDTKTPMWNSILTQICLRLPLAYLFAHLTKTPEFPNGQLSAMFYSLLAAWLSGGVILGILYSKKRRKLRSSADESWIK